MNRNLQNLGTPYDEPTGVVQVCRLGCDRVVTVQTATSKCTFEEVKRHAIFDALPSTSCQLKEGGVMVAGGDSANG